MGRNRGHKKKYKKNKALRKQIWSTITGNSDPYGKRWKSAIDVIKSKSLQAKLTKVFGPNKSLPGDIYI